ncbi:MAG: discoidin domain-containing protein [Armatimonadetes bacterium]|nr:discoidin domain-containing protein [Armatimonadota bacterium]
MSGALLLPVALCLVLVCQAATAGAVATVLPDVRLMAAEAAGGDLTHPEFAFDGNPQTELRFAWPNGGVQLTLDLGRPTVVEGVRITNGHSERLIWLTEVLVGPDPEHLRPLLARTVNLGMWRPAEVTEVALPPAVGRYAEIRLGAGSGSHGAISEVQLRGHPNLPERHLMCWASDIQRDFLDKLDYLDRDLGVTDLWLDFVETAFPQTNTNSGFAPWVESGALRSLRGRGVRYWLAEHEAFTQQVNDPADLHNDQAWETTLRQMRRLYAEAKRLGFRGLVYDAEDYNGVTAEAAARYEDVADHVDAWCFADEFGYGGQYYQRGLQVGRVIREVWGGPLLQVYEARLYAGKGDCRAGNYWWLRGIHDAGVEVWIATEKTYGAGQGEMAGPDLPDHLNRWFVRLRDFIPTVQQAYPFAARILPGFHPWNTRTRRPHYLPRYLDEQLTLAEACVPGYWIYTEGTSHAGDPRQVLDDEACRQAGVTAEQYLEVFGRHCTARKPRMPRG